MWPTTGAGHEPLCQEGGWLSKGPDTGAGQLARDTAGAPAQAYHTGLLFSLAIQTTLFSPHPPADG